MEFSGIWLNSSAFSHRFPLATRLENFVVIYIFRKFWPPSINEKHELLPLIKTLNFHYIHLWKLVITDITTIYHQCQPLIVSILFLRELYFNFATWSWLSATLTIINYLRIEVVRIFSYFRGYWTNKNALISF